MLTIGGGGWSWNWKSRSFSSIEVTQVEKNQSCFVDPFPYTLKGHSATIIPTGILVCGGYSKSSEQRCYEYKKTTGSWEPFPSMTTKRYDFDMIFLNQAVWAIGGWGGSKSTTTLDKYEMHTNVWTKHSIPFNVYDHCLTKISDERLILIGGKQSGSVSEEMRRQKYFNQVLFIFFWSTKIIHYSFSI